MINRSGPRHRFTSIDGWPGKLQLMVMAPHAQIGTDSDNTLTLVPGVSTLTDWAQCPDIIRAAFGTYVYGGVQPFQDQTDITTLWSPAISAAQRIVTVDTTYDAMNYTWPPVLVDLLVVKDGTSVATRPRYVEGFSDRSVVRVETYFSNTAWNARECRTDLPQPGTIKGDYFGKDILFPECLHDDVFMESQTSDSAEVYDCIPSESSNRQGTTIHFPATNHTEWIDHVVDVKTADLGGLHRRVVTTILAPPMSKIVYA